MTLRRDIEAAINRNCPRHPGEWADNCRGGYFRLMLEEGVSMSEHTAENDAAPAPSWRDVVRLARLALALRMPWAPPWVQRRVAGPGNRVTLVFPPERSEA